MNHSPLNPIALSLALAAAACGDVAKLPHHADTGETPTIATPNRTALPTINIAPAKGWPAGRTPVAAARKSRL